MHTRLVAICVALGSAAPALAGIAFHGIDSAATSTTLFGGDRRLDAMGFLGLGQSFGNDNFLVWDNGALTSNGLTYGWSDAVPRDMGTSGNVWEANPDRADAATPFAGEGSSTGTIGEVFGAFGAGYKNLSWILDGEGPTPWTLDLFFAPGQWLLADDNALTVELALLERGGNSDFNVYGIRTDNTLTPALHLARASMTSAGWSLDTLEIGGGQPVYGAGISLDASWGALRGFRVEGLPGFGGPDLVAIGSAWPVPAPGVTVILAAGGLMGATRWRRRRDGRVTH
ncbi:MAG: hypothetical protein KDA22_10455 [Phycisphaerales bacterium]|nr:hypothetical protein [Phycisphaerales bacterium]